MAEPYTVLHGGFHKTATTFLQKTLQRNAGRLQKAGVQYVPHRALRQHYTVPAQQNAYHAIGIRRKTVVTDAQMQAIRDSFFQPILAEAPDRLILSDENFAGHCGNCIKTGQLYRYRDAFIGSFARALPVPVREIYFGIRNYADFFAAAYVEYYRSLQADSTEVVPVRQMCTRLFNTMPGWNGVINVVTKHFPGVPIYVWRFEDFRASSAMAQLLLGRLAGPDVDLSRLTEPKANSLRNTASARAMAELERLAVTEGVAAMVAQRPRIQDAYPRNAENGRFDPFEPWERAHLGRLYEADVARLQTNGAVTFLGPDGPLSQTG